MLLLQSGCLCALMMYKTPKTNKRATLTAGNETKSVQLAKSTPLLNKSSMSMLDANMVNKEPTTVKTPHKTRGINFFFILLYLLILVIVIKIAYGMIIM